MKKTFAIMSLLLAGSIVASAQNYYDDDIYYNPKKDTSKTRKNYIADFANIDPDIYNMRGQYYTTPIDTIGVAMENGEDFIYTQAIQKFYNPTIVLDNANQLQDVLYNSYGNVNIVLEGGYPVFMPYYSSYPYLGSIYSPYWSRRYYYDPWYYWGSSWNWNWGWNWGWGPSYAWGWGPSYGWNWGWGPSYGWGWGPGWGWGWGPAWGGYPTNWYADYRPHGNSTVRPGNNWANSTRPGSDRNRPASVGSTRPGGNMASGGVYNGNTRPGSNIGNGSRPMGTPTGTNGNYVGSTTNGGTTVVGSDGHRYNGTGVSTVNGAVTNGSGVNVTTRPSGVTTTTRPAGTVSTRPSSTTTTTTRPSSTTTTTTRPSSTTTTTRSSGSSYGGSTRSSGSSYGGSTRSSGGSYGGGGGGGSRGGGGGGGGGGHRR